jgi:hypothetical protein
MTSLDIMRQLGEAQSEVTRLRTILKRIKVIASRPEEEYTGRWESYEVRAFMDDIKEECSKAELTK